MPTKYFLYARKSTEDEERQIMSIEAQLVELAEFAKREGLEIVEKFIESKSAKKPGREMFGQMITKIQQSAEPIGIIAWHPDRLARNSIDGGQIIYLIDTQKIVSLRFPTFWFEPTPQGLFMLQVAFGQSKYYSDNLVENVKRGIRQKLRRGEWLASAPFGYTNNPRTRNIEPDPLKAKIIRKAFEEYATGKHTLKSIGERLSFWGVVSSAGTQLSLSQMHKILTHQAYIGLIKHKGETYQGNFETIVPVATFEAVQKVLKRKARPRKTKQNHNFPFCGLLTCDECGGAITAQFAKGHGGLYRYYRCSKKFGPCRQGYVQEKELANQLKTRLQDVAISEDWSEKMLAQIEVWEKEGQTKNEEYAQNLKDKIKETEAKLDFLVNSFLDGMIDKDVYLQKKNELIRIKTDLQQRKSDFGREGKNWVEPLRQFIFSAHHANKLAASNDFHAIKSLVEKIGTNRRLVGGKVAWLWAEPFELLANRGPTTDMCTR